MFWMLETERNFKTMISKDKQYTSDGMPVRIFATDLKCGYPIIGAVLRENGEEDLRTWTGEGKFVQGNKDNLFDLKEVPVRKKVWVGFTKTPLKSHGVHSQNSTEQFALISIIS